MAIAGYRGFLGSGKTLQMITDAYRWSLAAGGAPIWGNLTLHERHFSAHRAMNPSRFKTGRISTPDDLIRMVAEGGGILCLDEVHQSFDARFSLDRKNVLLTQLLMFFRKMGITCLFTAQSERQIDLRFRDVTQIMVNCASFGPREAQTYQYERYNFQTGQMLQRWQVPPEQARHFYAMYETWEFTHALEFPSKVDEFNKLLKNLEVAALYARNYQGPPGEMWPHFLQTTGYQPQNARADSGGGPKKRGVRNPPHRAKQSRVSVAAGGGVETPAT